MLITKAPKLLSVSVMAHPSREKFFPYLKEKLGADVPFAIDHNSEGVWPNCKKAWSLYDPEAAFHVVIQDDAIVCENFLERAEEVIINAVRERGGEVAISFFFGNRATFKGIFEEGMKKGFAIKNRTHWGVAICLPTDIIPEMLKMADTYGMPQDDVRIGKFLNDKGIRVYFPLPSLIDHRTGSEGVPSLVGDPGQNRRAYKFIDSK